MCSLCHCGENNLQVIWRRPILQAPCSLSTFSQWQEESFLSPLICHFFLLNLQPNVKVTNSSQVAKEEPKSPRLQIIASEFLCSTPWEMLLALLTPRLFSHFLGNPHGVSPKHQTTHTSGQFPNLFYNNGCQRISHMRLNSEGRKKQTL